MMARQSEKIAIIDHKTYENIHNKDNASSSKRSPTSSKYRKKHRNAEKPTLLDFVIKPRQPQKQTKARKLRGPHLTIAKRSLLRTKPKRKGKVRLNPKKKVTKLKKSIWCYRASKKETPAEETEGISNETREYGQSEQDSKDLMENQLQNLSLKDKDTMGITPQIQAVHSIHSRRFRSYCDNCTRPRLKDLTIQLLKELDRFQKRAFAKNEVKARAHPRLVLGFNEALAKLRIKKVKLLLLATDCEKCPGENGIDELIEGLKFQCQQHNVPYCFSLLRREFSYALQKRAQIACAAVLDYDGANTVFADILNELEDARKEYKRLTAL
ncbi:selenocysteine insertion sequence-binding protein 2 [Drosophila bipectinata]|uniref:selenocysteine insertion sequence-binding protein 2 n=1 Tax=Drosophila bipectinata TaxID=42026 RepID=UPI001C894C96|nr:selenocysteine insertion sequence-binding protein 2 [Drosophila bipectinata]